MATAKDPGRLGLYGFRHRNGYTYDKMWIANSKAVKEPAVWDFVGEAGGQSLLVSVPPSYPARPVAGNLIGCFITPGADKEYTYPAGLKAEIEAEFGPYLFDVVFRTDDRDRDPAGQIYAMTDQAVRGHERAHARPSPGTCSGSSRSGSTGSSTPSGSTSTTTHHLYEPGNTLRDGHHRLLQAPRREDRRAPGRGRGRRHRVWSSRTTGRRG